MSDPQRIPISEAPSWVREIVYEEELLPGELAKGRANGKKVYRFIKTEFGNFLICFDQDTGEPTGIVWL